MNFHGCDFRYVLSLFTFFQHEMSQQQTARGDFRFFVLAEIGVQKRHFAGELGQVFRFAVHLGQVLQHVQIVQRRQNLLAK